MHKAPDFKSSHNASFSLQELDKPIAHKRYISLYRTVGDAFKWTDRLKLNEKELDALINKDATHIFVLLADKREVGFTELLVEKDYVELQYFGLFTEEIGKGYGKSFLQKAIEKAWSYDKDKVQLNTCDLDHPGALALYLKMGFSEVRRKKVSSKQ